MELVGGKRPQPEPDLPGKARRPRLELTPIARVALLYYMLIKTLYPAIEQGWITHLTGLVLALVPSSVFHRLSRGGPTMRQLLT